MQRNRFWAAAGRVLAVVTVALIMALMFVPSAWAVEYNVLYKFAGGTDGANPYAGMIFDSVGNLYGMTAGGGAYGGGIVFKLSPNPDGSWTQSVLYSFGGTVFNHEWGAATAGLIFDSGGNLYGIYGGRVFKLTPQPDGNWTENVLYRFTGGADGDSPNGGLIVDSAGNLYGTTIWGGDLNVCGSYGCGVVFKLAPNPDGTWTESVLHNFEDGSDGGFPFGSLIFDSAGSLYATTHARGNPGCFGGCGTVFKLIPQPDGSWTNQVISSFAGRPSMNPFAGVTFDASGNLYGTTGAWDSNYCSLGTVFKLAPNPDGSWKKSKLHAFKGTDGGCPYAGVILDDTGNVYGTTMEGGDLHLCGYGCGVVYKLTPQPDGHWTFTKLHIFRNFEHPWGNLVMDAAGKLYGTAPGGGHGFGVVFKITP